MFHDILVAFDGSESSRAALDLANGLAEQFGACLHVLTIARPPDFGTEVETSELIEETRRHCEQIQEDARKQLNGKIERVFYAVLVGHPAEQIVHYSETHDVDHIVIGHRGRSLFERWLLGSVARQVIAYARCSVTVVRPRTR